MRGARFDRSPSVIPEAWGQAEGHRAGARKKKIALGSRHQTHRENAILLLPWPPLTFSSRKIPAKALPRRKGKKKKKDNRKRYTFCTQLTTTKKGQNPTR